MEFSEEFDLEAERRSHRKHPSVWEDSCSIYWGPNSKNP